MRKLWLVLLAFLLIIPASAQDNGVELDSSYRYRGFSLDFDSTLMSKPYTEIIPAEPTEPGGMFWLGLPDITDTRFFEYALLDENHRVEPRVYIMETARFYDGVVQPDALADFEKLQGLIDAVESGELGIDELPIALDPMDENRMPYILSASFRPVFFSVQPAYVNGEMVRGVSYLTGYTQNVDNQNLTYVFQGMSIDNQYYIGAEFPVQSFAISDDMTQEAIINALAGADYDSFTPALAIYDAIIASIGVPQG